MTTSTSSLTLLAHAYRLTHARLVRSRASVRDEADRIAELLEDEAPKLEPIAARDVARASLSAAKRGEDLAVLCELANALVEIQDGRPVLRSIPITPLLVSIMDPDILAVAVAWQTWQLEGDFAEDAILSWPMLLRQHRAGFDNIFARPMADTHVHLGGAMPTNIRWLTAITSPPSLELARSLAAGDDERTDDWASALERARACLISLARSRRPGEAPLRASLDADALVDALQRFWPARPHDQFDPRDAPELGGSMSLGYLIPERALLMRGLAHPDRQASLFEYIRVKNAFHRAIVLRPGGRGLARFRATSHRSHAVPSSPNVVLRVRRHMSAVIESYLTNLGGHASPRRAARPDLKLELRVTMPARNDLVRDFLRGWALGAADALRRWDYPALKLGLLFHVSRSRPEGVSPAAARAEYVAQHQRLFEWLVELSAVRFLVVGIDAAGDELAAPPRDFIGAFEKMRTLVDHQRPDRSPRIRLGFTFHAGEDFRDLLSGIRFAHEASELLSLRPGDRLGHALALFWNADDFYRARRRAQPRLREHLLDLVWAAALLDHAGQAEPARFARERLITQLVQRKVDSPTDAVIRLISRLRSELTGLTEDALLAELLGEHARKLRADTLFELRADPPWIRFVEQVREVAVAGVHRSGLYVEVNPTSNLLIGNFEDYHDLPYLKEYAMTADRLSERIPITLNTDDPGVFHTTLTNEYVQVGRALLTHGLTHGQVWDWLDHVRRTALRSSFIPPDAPSGRALYDQLMALGSG